MAFTVGTNTTGADYIVRLTLSDFIDESVRKVFTVRNVGGNIQNAMRVVEAATQSAFEKAGASIAVGVTGASTTTTSLGAFPKIGDQLVLGFDRPHPLDASRLATAVFVIPAPHPDVYDLATLKPDMIRGEDFATALAADRPTALGALVDWLEDALVMEVFGTVYAGGWTYREARSALISTPREYDRSDLT